MEEEQTNRIKVNSSLLTIALLVCIIFLSPACRQKQKSELWVGVVDFQRSGRKEDLVGSLRAGILILTTYSLSRFDVSVEEGNEQLCLKVKNFDEGEFFDLLKKSIEFYRNKTGYSAFVSRHLSISRSEKCSVKILFPAFLSMEDVKSVIYSMPIIPSGHLSSPYVVKTKTEREVVLERSSEDSTFYSKIHLRVFSSPEKAFGELLIGNIDVIFPFSFFLQKVYSDTKGIFFKTYWIRGYSYYLVFNPRKSFLPRIKKAFDISINRNKINQKEFGGMGRIEGLWESRYMPLAAASLIKEGKSMKNRFEIIYPSWWPEARRVLFHIKRDLFKVGFKVNVRPASFGEIGEAFLGKGKWDILFVMGPLPRTRGAISFWCQALAEGTNPFASKNVDLCKAAEKGQEEEMRRISRENPPFLFLVSLPMVAAISDSIEVPNEKFIFERIDLWH